LVLQQNRLLWYGHVLRKDGDDWVKKYMEYEARKMNKEDAMDRCKWRKMIKDVR